MEKTALLFTLKEGFEKGLGDLKLMMLRS